MIGRKDATRIDRDHRVTVFQHRVFGAWRALDFKAQNPPIEIKRFFKASTNSSILTCNWCLLFCSDEPDAGGLHLERYLFKNARTLPKDCSAAVALYSSR
jgi:hypothetical protein